MKEAQRNTGFWDQIFSRIKGSAVLRNVGRGPSLIALEDSVTLPQAILNIALAYSPNRDAQRRFPLQTPVKSNLQKLYAGECHSAVSQRRVLFYLDRPILAVKLGTLHFCDAIGSEIIWEFVPPSKSVMYKTAMKLNTLLIFLSIVTACGSTKIRGTDANLREIPFPNEVFVLGTIHLAEHKDTFRSESLEAIAQLIKKWRPTQIAIEHRPTEDIRKAELQARYDSSFAALLRIFDGKVIDTGTRISKRTGISYENALAKVNDLWKREAELSVDERANFVELLLIVYDQPNATLQWSKLSEKDRLQTRAISAHTKELLRNQLASVNEIYSLAIPIARELGHRRVWAVDSQEDGTTLLAVPDGKLKALFEESNSQTFAKSAFIKEEKAKLQTAIMKGNLLPAYEFINRNGPAYDQQWAWLMTSQNSDGLHRLRFANWETRNLRIASRIQAIASSSQPERILVLIGASHKSILERYLRQSLSLRVIDFETVNSSSVN